MSKNLQVAIIGAGMAGILAAIKLKEFGIKNIIELLLVQLSVVNKFHVETQYLVISEKNHTY